MLSWISEKISLYRNYLFLKKKDIEYNNYIKEQIKRTILKNNNRLSDSSRNLIDKSAELINFKNKKILCIGCRNVQEIDYIKTKNPISVSGIDLVSNHKNIIRMDMHETSFEDNTFDIIYSSHSFEHAKFPDIAVREWIRIIRPGGFFIIEVPKDIDTSGSDLNDFKSIYNLHSYFRNDIHKVILAEELDISEKNNYAGTAIIRTIIQILK